MSIVNDKSPLDQSQLQELDELRALRAALENAVECSHEFYNLMTIIIGYSDMLFDMLGTDHIAREPLEEIRSAAQRSTILIGQLRSLSKKQSPSPAEVDLCDMLRNTATA
jgi:two-component system, cell cycle sensor histidine kinase and response regulator CckA